ncbi:hypothetical protein ABVV53_09365 [Novosphingobium sp. RD2P27]|uniref:Uncharacterized protein n=1 Tax=Novosphingobium kalidii TaxID=3230299 RepID=A0ABV2D1E1_9SPHN
MISLTPWMANPRSGQASTGCEVAGNRAARQTRGSEYAGYGYYPIVQRHRNKPQIVYIDGMLRKIRDVSSLGWMEQDQVVIAAQLPDNTEGQPGPCARRFEDLQGTIVAEIDLEGAALEVTGKSADGQERWRLSIPGSARFIFSHKSEGRAWLVEANFDAGGSVRSSDRAMFLAMCGAHVQSVSADDEALRIESDDGRAIEVPYDLNDESIGFTILRDESDSAACRVVLQADPAADGGIARLG